MKKPATTFALLLVTAVLALSACKKTSNDVQSDFGEYLEWEMDDQHIPAMAVLVFDDEQILYESYLGESDRENNIALADNHLFLLASISKTVTATALMQLYDDGKFQLDDPINNYLPFEVTVPDQATPITFRMLLTHTSGIADGPALDNQYYNGEDSPTDLAQFMESYLVPGGADYNATQNFHSFKPGTEHEYSNEGSALIGVLVEQLSGVDFNTYCKQNIFEPLGMDNTYWRLDEIAETIVVPYDYYNRDWEKHAHYTFTDYPNGGLRSTVRDMHTFAQVLMDGEANGIRILQASTAQLMRTPQIPDIDSEVGLHLFKMSRAINLWGHDGGEKGVSTIMAWDPDNGIGAIILCNQGEAILDDALEEAYLYGAGGYN